MEGRKLSIRSGFASIIGRPNVGKSTLINSLIGHKIAIISDKPQTTRNQIRGIFTTEHGQVVFIDTPGMHKPRHRLGEFMVEVARRTLKEVDLILYVVDAAVEFGGGEQYILDQLTKVTTPVFLIINKIDLVSRPELLKVIEIYKSKGQFAEIVPVSAVKRDNLDRLSQVIFDYLPEGPYYYPTDMISDQPEYMIMAELIREKVLLLTREEIPHSVAVEAEEVKVRSNDLVYLRAVIYVERDTQKGILIGKQGKMLKEVGKLAREDIQNLLGNQVYLDLWVKVKKDWRNNPVALSSLGYDLRQ
ncbi:MAG: GTPase Era [Syntrophomonadaceae bacterium]|nr:GTPase Era [Syntrophomonadaceae bacterium]